MSYDEKTVNPFPPAIPRGARVLILGSFPSKKSREAGFYYGHPQNRFWRVLSAVFSDEVPSSTEEKRAFLSRHGIALFDVIASCNIVGSSDSSVKDAVPNDISALVREYGITRICTNGNLAYALYKKYIFGTTGIEPIRLPSTSPANASWSLERLTVAWQKVRKVRI